ncbi:YigZ family protein [Pediococcus argentinicus]|uniref:YigZ family protein n=1 Tax=Pediococcus argentinicus TaxID=480391 RepID=A0A0R2NM65_9LACO|nr:YigZ family protein [Pediococcus argentinicus]KRO25755.1 hypothetical protein IV88_GL001518 [Pediococcus argentinicus]NKZ21921.1 YigZ family protein [Pediococcus argentinicus]GEP19090.1 YigZ family protein [Pediococcus argentinicus]
MTTFFSVSDSNESTQIIKKSEFITTVVPIKDEEDAQSKINQISDQYAKANHHCFAYLLGNHQEIQRSSDNGEPSGTAGVPILEVLKREHMTNLLVVVTRFFGGIKLGAGGLIRAYGSSTSQALTESHKVALIKQVELKIHLDYNQNDQLNYCLNQVNVQPQQTDYDTRVTTTVLVDETNLENFKQQLIELFNGNIQIEQLEEVTTSKPTE